MNYIFGSTSAILSDFVENNRNKIVGISRNKCDFNDYLWDFESNTLDVKKLLSYADDEEINIIYAAAYKSDSLYYNQSDKNIDDIFKVNLFAYMNVVKKFLPTMIKHKKGNIIYISSSYAKLNQHGSIPYSVSKGAAEIFTRGIAQEYTKFNIKANNIILGFFDTPMWRSISPEIRSKMISNAPSKRLGQYQDVSQMINYLNSASPYCTGSDYYIDGAL
jgi:3-oxoacyl-[acyl-carrier protein] reductase